MPSSSSWCTLSAHRIERPGAGRSLCCLLCLQDVLSALVAHLGSCNLSQADVALESLLALAKSQAGLQEHADALATSLMEWLEFYDTAQIHKVSCRMLRAACAHTATFQPDGLAGSTRHHSASKSGLSSLALQPAPAGPGTLEQSQQPAQHSLPVASRQQDTLQHVAVMRKPAGELCCQKCSRRCLQVFGILSEVAVKGNTSGVQAQTVGSNFQRQLLLMLGKVGDPDPP